MLSLLLQCRNTNDGFHLNNKMNQPPDPKYGPGVANADTWTWELKPRQKRKWNQIKPHQIQHSGGDGVAHRTCLTWVLKIDRLGQMDEYKHALFFEAKDLKDKEKGKIRRYFQIRRESGGGDCGMIEEGEGDTHKICFKEKEGEESNLPPRRSQNTLVFLYHFHAWVCLFVHPEEGV